MKPCVSSQIYLRNEKGRYMEEIMEIYVRFFSFFLYCSNPCAPSLLLSERSLPKLNVKMSTDPKLSVLGLYCCHRVTLPQILLPTWRTSEVNPVCRNCDWLKNWRENAVYFQVFLHSAWRVLVYTLIDAHITTWCLEKKNFKKTPKYEIHFELL